MKYQTPTGAAASRAQTGERGSGDILQTVSGIASVLSFLIGLTALPPFLGAAPQPAPIRSDVLRLLSGPGQTALLLFSFPIFEILNTFSVISMAKIAVSLLRRCGVEFDSDLAVWCLLLLVLLPVAMGANLVFVIILFGEAFAPLPLACIAGSVLMTTYFAFRWLQKALY
jgi:hypothetical protein